MRLGQWWPTCCGRPRHWQIFLKFTYQFTKGLSFWGMGLGISVFASHPPSPVVQILNMSLLNVHCVCGVLRVWLFCSVQEEDSIHMPKTKRVKRTHVAFIDD